jgi:hypothetical protein
MATPLSPTYVSVQPNSTGPAVDLANVDSNPQSSTNTVTVREICAIGDPNNWFNVAGVTANGEVQTLSLVEASLLTQILKQLVLANQILQRIDNSGRQYDLGQLEVQLTQTPGGTRF